VLCFRYALLASAKELDAEEIRRALARAVALKPDFDDARFNLALLEKNLGRYESALEHLRAMRNVAPARAFTYWIATADALNELGRRDEAKGAAQTAASHATTPAERQHASQLAYLAETDLAVQFTRDESGQPKMITTRTPHNLPNWNAFIEPGDEIHRVQGTLREINCDGAITLIMVRADGKLLKLTIPDPSRVQMRNAPAEFVCGRQRATPVTIEYAASKTAGSKSDGVVRGMEFQ
jgi:hypothetical protein